MARTKDQQTDHTPTKQPMNNNNTCTLKSVATDFQLEIEPENEQHNSIPKYNPVPTSTKYSCPQQLMRHTPPWGAGAGFRASCAEFHVQVVISQATSHGAHGCVLSSVFLGGARRLELSPCTTHESTHNSSGSSWLVCCCYWRSCTQ